MTNNNENTDVLEGGDANGMEAESQLSNLFHDRYLKEIEDIRKEKLEFKITSAPFMVED